MSSIFEDVANRPSTTARSQLTVLYSNYAHSAKTDDVHSVPLSNGRTHVDAAL